MPPRLITYLYSKLIQLRTTGGDGSQSNLTKPAAARNVLLRIIASCPINGQERVTAFRIFRMRLKNIVYKIVIHCARYYTESQRMTLFFYIFFFVLPPPLNTSNLSAVRHVVLIDTVHRFRSNKQTIKKKI